MSYDLFFKAMVGLCVACVVAIIALCSLEVTAWAPERTKAREAACASRGWTYGHQSHTTGKTTTTWLYCVDGDGFIREMP